MKVLGLDISKHTGWAAWNTKADVSSIVCDVLEFPPKASIEYCADQTGLKITALIKEHKPDFVVMETALKMSPGGQSASIVSSCMLHGAVYATLGNWGKPWGTIAVQRWRSIFFEKGFQPPLDKNGKKDWKAAAIAKCEERGIILPSRKTVKDDAAEACAIAICWHGAEIHAGRYISAFTNFKLERNARAAA